MTVKSQPEVYRGALIKGPRVWLHAYPVCLVVSAIFALFGHEFKPLGVAGLAGLFIFGWLESCRERVDFIDVDTPSGSRRFYFNHRHRCDRFKLTSDGDEGVMTRTRDGDFLGGLLGYDSYVYRLDGKPVMSIHGNGPFKAKTLHYSGTAVTYDWPKPNCGKRRYSTNDFTIEDKLYGKMVVFSYSDPFLMPCLACVCHLEYVKYAETSG